MVLKVVCPTVRLPSEATNRKRPRGDMGWSEDASTYSSSSSNGKRRNADSGGRDEINALFSSVKDFSSSSFAGMKKKQHKEEKLTKLGAPDVKQQKMPFKMRLGLNAASKKRDVKNQQTAKDSGVVLAAAVNKKNRNDSKRRESSTNIKSSSSRASSKSRGRSESSSFGINTKSGVMHLSQKRLPDKLTRSRG
jgi:hypothetical protein